MSPPMPTDSTTDRRPLLLDRVGMLALGSFLQAASFVGAQTLPSFSETLEVRLLELDVSVTDRQGVPIRGLERDAFQLTLDGETREPDFFAEIPGAREVQGAREVEGARDGPLSVLLLVDSRTLRQASRERAFEELTPQLEALLAPEGARLRVVHYDGRIQMVKDWTEEVAEVETALAAIATLPTWGESVNALEAPAQQALKNMLTNLRGGSRERIVAMASIDAVMGEMQSSAAQGVRETEEILLGLQSVVRSLALTAGPKAVVYLTGGWAVRPGAGAMNRLQSALTGTSPRDNDPAASQVSQSDTPGSTVISDGGFMNRDVGPEILRRRQSMENLDLHAELDILIAAANAYRVQFFPVMAPPGDAAAADARGRGRGAIEVSDMREGPLRLAEKTGGRAFLSETSIERVLGEIGSGLGHRYSLALSLEPGASATMRDVGIKLRQRGATVRYPQLVTTRTLESRLIDLALAGLDQTVVANPHRLELTPLGQTPTGDGRRQVQLALMFPIDRLGLAAASGLHQASSQVAVAVLDSRGKLADQQHLRVPLQIPDADLEKAKASFYRAAIELKLPPGPHQIGLALWDAIAQSSSTVVTVVDVEGD